MQFENGEYSWILLIVLLLAGLELRAAKERRRSAKLFGDDSRSRKRDVSVWLRVGIASLLFVSVLRPQWGYEWRESTRSGVDIVVAVDLSESMMTKDVPPSRLDRARFLIIDLLKRLQGDRIGLVAFAGVPFVQSPLTYDYGAFRMILEQLSPDLIPLPGSNIHDALAKSIDVLVPNGSTESKSSRGRAIVLLTDGEELEGKMEEVKDRAQELGVQIYILGIGTPEGAPIPFRGGFKRDREGNIIVSRLNPSILDQLARASGGVFVRVSGSDEDLRKIYEDGIKNALQSSEFGSAKVKRWHEYYQFPLFLGLMLILLEVFARRIGRPRKLKNVLGILFLLHNPLHASAISPEQAGSNGKMLLEQGDFQGALEKFSESDEQPELLLGQGSSFYRLGRFNEAFERFSRAAQIEGDTQGDALYNSGNALVQLGKYKEAIELYEKALKLSPDDREIKENLEYTKKLLESPEKQNPENKKENQQNSQSKDKKDEENKQGESGNDSKQSQGGEKSQDSKKSEGESGKEKNEQNKTDTQGDAEQKSDKPPGEQGKADQQPGEKNDSNPKDDASSEEKKNESAGNEKDEKGNEKHSGRATAGQEEREEENAAGGALLNNVQENRDALKQFRRAQAIEELERAERTIPEKDW